MNQPINKNSSTISGREASIPFEGGAVAAGCEKKNATMTLSGLLIAIGWVAV
jgi:hypothetical protein